MTKYPDEPVEELQDVDETPKALKRSRELTDTLNKLAEIFLTQSGESFNDMMSAGVKVFADLINIDRFSVFQSFPKNGMMYMTQIYRWEKTSGTVKTNENFFNITFENTAPSWIHIFHENKVVNTPVSKMDDPIAAATLSSVGMVSAFASPIYINDVYWGFAIFEDHKTERIFDEDLAEMMRSAGFLCANAIIRSELERIQSEMERELINEKDFTREIIDSASIGLAILDESLKVIDCNDAIMGIFGGVTKQYYSDNFYALSPEYQPDGQSSVVKGENILRRAYEGEKQVLEWMHISVNGEDIPCEITLTRVKYNNKYRVLAYIYDLRNTKKMEKAVLGAELTQLMIDSMPLACVLIDKDYKVFTCNNEAVEYFGAKDKEELLKTFYDRSPEYQPDGGLSSEMSLKVVQKTFEDGYNRFEWTHQKNDESVPSEVILVRVMYKGEFVIVGYIRDLREQIAHFNEMEKIYESLRSARNTAEAASRTKTNFLANMSHEMRTPMNVIVGLTGLMAEEENVPLSIKENLEKINIAGNTLLGLINDLLDISKIEAGKLELMPVQYDLASLLNDIITLNLIRKENKPITFKLEINEELPSSLLGDDLRVKQILNNLLSNAFKYTREGTITLGVSSQNEDAFTGNGGVWLSFYVSDTGIGIREADVSKLFTDYNQVDAKANRAIQGTGLGLSITKRLVELMDGEITVDSEYGKGTTFRTRIRQDFVTDKKIGRETVENLCSFHYSEKKKSAHGKLVRPDLSYARVLVVDDMKTNLDVSAGMLRKYKMQVDCVENGEEAIDRISAGQPVYDAVFMDHMMPGLDGIQTTIVIRTLHTDYAKNLPIIALTANAISGNEQMFLENGFNAYLPKPFSAALLDSIVQKWVRDKSKE